MLCTALDKTIKAFLSQEILTLLWTTVLLFFKVKTQTPKHLQIYGFPGNPKYNFKYRIFERLLHVIIKKGIKSVLIWIKLSVFIYINNDNETSHNTLISYHETYNKRKSYLLLKG